MKVLDHDTGNLLRAVVQPHSEARGKTILELASKIGSWEETIAGARQHGILPMLYSELAANEAAVPPGALDLARREFERNALHCFANASELLEVLTAFEKAEIPAMPFKGVVLGASAYGDMTARAAGDLDVLISYQDLVRATALLKDRGYHLKTQVSDDGSPAERDTFEFHFERHSDGMVMELRWRFELTTPRFRRDLGMQWVWGRRRTALLAGAVVPHLDEVSELLVLCMHGSKHTWSRLVWICDVAKLLESKPALDWDSTRREAKRVGLWNCLALGVLLAHRMAGAHVPGKVLKDFEANRGALKLAQFLAQHLPEEPGRTPEGRVPYNICLLQFHDRVRVMLSPTFFGPNEHDRAMVKLPKALEPLYYVIRPIRMLIDRRSR